MSLCGDVPTYVPGGPCPFMFLDPHALSGDVSTYVPGGPCNYVVTCLLMFQLAHALMWWRASYVVTCLQKPK